MRPEVYADLAQDFDRVMQEATFPEALGFIRLVARFLPPQAVVVDIGCGTGHGARLLLAARPDLRLHLVEPAPAMMALARARPELAGCTFHAGTLADFLATTPLQVDGLVLQRSFYALCGQRTEYPSLVRQWRARLRPGGIVAIHSPDEPLALPVVTQRMQEVLRQQGLAEDQVAAVQARVLPVLQQFNHDVAAGHYHLFSADALVELFTAEGFWLRYWQTRIHVFQPSTGRDWLHWPRWRRLLRGVLGVCQGRGARQVW